MATQKQQTGISTKQGLVVLAILAAIGFGIIMGVASLGSNSSVANESNDITAINSCLSSATERLNEEWPDGDTKNVREGHKLNMDYLNSQIDCYTPYNGNGEYDSYVEQIKDRKTDEQSSYQTQVQAASNNQSSRMTCTSSAIGSTAFTSCY